MGQAGLGSASFLSARLGRNISATLHSPPMHSHTNDILLLFKRQDGLVPDGEDDEHWLGRRGGNRKAR
jgi:hypothetical protein